MATILGLPEHLMEVPPAPLSPDDPARDEKRAAFLAWRNQVERFRVQRHIACAEHPELRPFEIAYCANSPAYFAAIWHRVWEPRTGGKAGTGQIAFIPFARQIDLWDAMLTVVLPAVDHHADAALSKSRGWGGSWWLCELALWGWLFSDQWKQPQPWSPLLLSRKEEYVDSSKSKSLFWKIREMINDTPHWMLPKGFDSSQKGPHIQRMWIFNPVNGNTITGESTNSDAGRGDRATWAGVDEPAAMDEDVLDSIWDTLEGTTDHRLGVGTESFEHGTAWWDLQHPKDPMVEPPYLMTADWWENPLNDDAWYQQKQTRHADKPHVFEWEYRRNPWAGSLVPWVYPAAQGIGVDSTLEPKTGRPTYLAIDPGAADPTALVLGQENGMGGVDFLGSYSNQRVAAEFYVPLLKPVLFDAVDKDWREMHFIDWMSLGGQVFHYEHDELQFARLVDATGGAPRYIGDTHGDKTEGVSADSVYDRWGRYGINVNKDRTSAKDLGSYEKQSRTHEGRQEAVKEQLAKWRFAPSAELVLKCLQAYRFKPRDKPTTTPNRVPLHDNSSHIATACEYLACYRRRLGAIATRDYAKPVHNRLHGLIRGPRGLPIARP